MGRKTAVIIGAGPAGLTAAYELLEKTDVQPIVYEMSDDIGGISKTVNYKGNRIDLGGHRFFSKSERVMEWWQNILPLQGAPAKDDIALERNIPLSKKADAPDPEKTDRVLLARNRFSRIFHTRKFFSYPISLNLNALANLGALRVGKIGLSYIRARLFPFKEERTLEEFFINRFGRELYRTFFENYTEKVWGIPCKEINSEWGRQRIKGLSVSKAVLHAAKKMVSKDLSITQKGTETSLIEQFLYPKLGPGQMWEEVARIVKEKGAQIHMKHRVTGLKPQGSRIVEIEVRDEDSGAVTTVKGDYFFSTMPVKELIGALDDGVPDDVRQVSQGLVYRDFITVGMLLKRLKISNETGIKTINDIIPDNWIYIQEEDVKLGRLQLFNNWSPYMVKNDDTVWVGLEYFCNEGDELWSKPDNELVEFATDELEKIGFIEKGDLLDSVVIRMPKAYPCYFGTYDRFDVVRDFIDKFENLFLIGRNGMHRYNNQDHSMLTAMVAVENIVDHIASKNNIWCVNTEKNYHETK